MDRRNFLGLMAAGAAMQVLPALATEAPISANAQIWTAETLTLEMEKMFACRMGPPMAFFEVVKETGEIVETPRTLPYPPEYNRFIYQTYGFAVEGGDAWEAEHQLAKHFYDEFSKLDTKNLVWRRKPQFETQEVTEYGEVWATAEDVEDLKVSLENKPQNVDLDFSTNNYRYVTRKYPLHRMTMRLVFTDQQDFPISIARQEGEPLPRIS